jgi:hypothetical protein
MNNTQDKINNEEEKQKQIIEQKRTDAIKWLMSSFVNKEEEKLMDFMNAGNK